LPRGLSRATAYAARAALLAGVASAAACGGESEDTSAKNKTPQQQSTGGDASGGQAASGGQNASGGAIASGGTESGSGGITIGDGGTTSGSGGDLGQGGYIPVPIYGGVFPDPELRAKV
jgi:hypothetical protein